MPIGFLGRIKHNVADGYIGHGAAAFEGELLADGCLDGRPAVVALGVRHERAAPSPFVRRGRRVGRRLRRQSSKTQGKSSKLAATRVTASELAPRSDLVFPNPKSTLSNYVKIPGRLNLQHRAVVVVTSAAPLFMYPWTNQYLVVRKVLLSNTSNTYYSLNLTKFD